MKYLPGLLILLIPCLLLLTPESAQAAGPASGKPVAGATSPASAPKPAAPAAASLPLPDLIVERIWLDGQCRINFQIRNNGSGPIPDAQYAAGEMKLFIGSSEVALSLSRRTGDYPAVDPAGTLKRAGGVVQYNTGHRLEERRLVRVWLDHSDRIRESGENNNTRQESLNPSCISVLGPAAATAARSGAPGTGAQGTGRIGMPQSNVRITSFHLSRRTGMMATAAAVAGDRGAAADDTATLAAREEIELRWTITGCNAVNVETQLRGWSSDRSTSTNPALTETRRELPDRCFEINGSSRFIASEERDYVLTARVSGPGAGTATDERTFHIRLKKPRLVLEKPEVNIGDLTVVYYLANRGEADYPAPGVNLSGRYTVTNWNRGITYASGNISQRNLSLPRGGRVEIGRVTMTDREHLYAATKILAEAHVEDQYGYASGTDRDVSYLHEWETRTTTLGADLFLAFFDALSGEIRINNYRSPGSNTTRTRPGVNNDSYVEIMGQRRTFTPEFLSAKLTGSASGRVLFDYRPFINNVTTTIGGRRATSITDRNTVNLHITVNTAGGAEIKGWRYRDNEYNDEDAPDLDLTRLELDVKIHLNLRNGKIVIDGIWVVPTVNVNAQQDWAWLLNMLTPWLERMATDQISNYFAQLVNTAEVRDGMNAEIARALSLLRVDWIERFELNSRGLTMTYIPGG